jgi:outer membrane receptor protein involved in Fe transport
VEAVSIANRGAGAFLDLGYGGLRLMSAATEWSSTGFIEGTVSATHLTRQFSDLGYGLAVNPSWDMSFDATFTRTTFAEAPFPNVTRDSNEAILEWTNLVKLGARDRLSVGALANHLDGTELYTATVPATVTAHGGRFGGALYAQLEHRLIASLKLIVGFQTNKIGSIPLDTVPRGGAVWTPTAHTSLKALYSQAFRAPSLDENLLDNPGLGGNPNLKPEKVATFDLGAFFESERAQLGVDYFHSKITNNIVNLPGPTRAVYFNLGEVTFDGVEAEGKYYLSRELFLQGSTLYQVNVDGQGTSNVSPIPTIGFKAGASYQSRRWTASVFDVSDGPFDHYAAVNPLPGWRHIISLQLRADVSKLLHLDKSFGLAVFGHANNLANQAIWLPSGFSSVDTVPVQQGRTLFFGLEVALGRSGPR